MIQLPYKQQWSWVGGELPLYSNQITDFSAYTMPSVASMYGVFVAYAFKQSSPAPSMSMIINRSANPFSTVASTTMTASLSGEGTRYVRYYVLVVKQDSPLANADRTYLTLSSGDVNVFGGFYYQQFLIYNHDDTDTDTNTVYGAATDADLDTVSMRYGSVSFGGFMATDDWASPAKDVTCTSSSGDESTVDLQTWGGSFMARCGSPPGVLGVNGDWVDYRQYMGVYYALNSKGIHVPLHMMG